ncbi:O-antigen translocase [Pseudomonas helleri]|uniref:Oligosaccharide flippase family protein n=1 Tax=Pseudomonas helleri TaxID=1608996 RepID=A0A7X1XJM5_9PSED|nr:O-antigen translocase [Pseudomonas helleri]MQT92792.1 oligosaccharide flippase family protein [Pseudomonas helleri]
MSMLKTSALNAIAVIFKLITMLGINKVLAVYVGPSGYAALGQLQNALTMITTLSSGAVNTGVTKYTAEYHSDVDAQYKIWRTASFLAITGSLISGVVVVLYSKEMAGYFFKREDYSNVFVWVAFSLVFFTFNALLMAVINGKKEIGKYVKANILGSLFSLCVTGLLAWQMGLYGALISLGIYQALSLVATVFICSKLEWFKVSNFFGRVDKVSAINLSKFAAMAVTSAICLPISQILIRNHLIVAFGSESAGYWEAMWRLSSAYLMLATTTLSVYYLPRLSELHTVKEIISEMTAGYKIILPVCALGCVLIFLLKDFIIQILFTPQFIPMRKLFMWQLVGDVMKIGSWLLAFVMLGKAMVKLYIVTEIAFSATFYFAVVCFTNKHGLVGVTEAYAFNYFLYWIVIAVSLYVFFRTRKEQDKNTKMEER